MRGANAVSALLIVRQQRATGAANNPDEGQTGALEKPEPNSAALSSLKLFSLIWIRGKGI